MMPLACFAAPLPVRAQRAPAARLAAPRRCARARAANTRPRTPTATLAALVFDCDGVIVESEELHRRAYNECWAAAGLGFEWSYEFYEVLQNSVGGGKEKMRWYFDRHGWPAGAGDEGDVAARDAFVQDLHVRKTAMYGALVEGGGVAARPGVLRLMDEAADAGLRLAICSAASADAVALVLDRVVGADRLARFDVVLAGDFAGADTRKKPDPMIYNVARERLGVDADSCVVVEDSRIGLLAAQAAGMRVLITHTPYTATQDFSGAGLIVPGLGDPGGDEAGDVVTVETLRRMGATVG
jgi:HAD superfamily hydrolase (TIGR01509 family)